MLTAEEYRSPFLRAGFFLLAGLALFLFLLFWYQDDPVWRNSLRLGSFICFSGAVFLGLRLREGSYSLRLIRTGESVRVTFLRRNREVGTEEIDTSRLHRVEPAAADPPLPLLPDPDQVYIVGRFDQTEDDQVHLFHFGGRPLKFDPETARRMIHFLSSASPDRET